MSPEHERGGFIKGLKLLDATTLVIGSMIGSGVFIVSADIARTVKSPGLLLAVWIVTALLTVTAALSYAELAAAMPRAGGQYVFLREAFGDVVAFLYGWTFFLVIGTGIAAAVAVAFAKFLGVLVPWVSASNVVMKMGTITVSTQQLVAMLVVLILTYVNCRGVRHGARVQNIFTFLKVAAIVLLIAGGIAFGGNSLAIKANFTNMFAMDFGFFELVAAMGVAMVGSLFAMDSWSYVCCTAAEVERPKRNLPLALLLGTMSVGVLYLVMNLVYMSVLPVAGDPAGTSVFTRGIQYAAEDRVGTAVVEAFMGNAGMYAIAVAIMISTFGCVNGNILMSARLYYAMAVDGLFFKSVGKINPKTHVPVTALVVGGLWACMLTLTGGYSELLDYVIFATLVFYILTIVGLMVLRKTRPGMDRPYRALGYPWLQLFYIMLASVICAVLLIYKPAYTWPGLAIVASGLPVYFVWRRVLRRRAAQFESG